MKLTIAQKDIFLNDALAILDRGVGIDPNSVVSSWENSIVSSKSLYEKGSCCLIGAVGLNCMENIDLTWTDYKSNIDLHQKIYKNASEKLGINHIEKTVKLANSLNDWEKFEKALGIRRINMIRDKMLKKLEERINGQIS